MNKWIRKSLFVVISILTFGLVTPAQLMNAVNAEAPQEHDVFENISAENSFTQEAGSYQNQDSFFNREEYLQDLFQRAEAQSYQKFGSKIKPLIEDEFREIILPKIETAIKETAAIYPEENLQNLTITEQPGAGCSEKIFHIKDSETGKDIMRFHVRRDNPPQSGYWFNFHYHTCQDNFQTHHEIGSIFWAKDTPPKWLS